jgi:lipopolysaccharide/colanic/teichoic acid biosynthesis glycosyltransferase
MKQELRELKVENEIVTEPSVKLEQKIDANIIKLVEGKVGPLGIEFVLKYVPDLDSKKVVLLDTTSRFNIEKQRKETYKAIVNVAMCNGIDRINKFFLAANRKLGDGDIFLGRAETITERKRRAYKKWFRPVSDLYYFADFIFHRVVPKIGAFQFFYFFVTKGRRRVLSRAELLGRLCSCGFEIVEELEIENKLYFAVRKIREAEKVVNPSYGPLFGMRRIGKGGKEIVVYKVRTMHPYSEFLQEYIYKRNDLQEGGKFADDFRISTLGRVFRKFWIDELPMIYNLFNGDMKVIGVRPLSRHYLGLYSEELKELRKTVKPGLIPPFYADMPKTLQEIQESEKRYILAYKKNPLTTDLRYFSKAMVNILFKKARSK